MKRSIIILLSVAILALSAVLPVRATNASLSHPTNQKIDPGRSNHRADDSGPGEFQPTMPPCQPDPTPACSPAASPKPAPTPAPMPEDCGGKDPGYIPLQFQFEEGENCPEIILNQAEELVDDRYYLPGDAEVEPGTVLLRISVPHLGDAYTLVIPELPAEQQEFLEKLGLNCCMLIKEREGYTTYNLRVYRGGLLLDVCQFASGDAMAVMAMSYEYDMTCIRFAEDSELNHDRASVDFASYIGCFWKCDYSRTEREPSMKNSDCEYVVADLAEVAETSITLSEQQFIDMQDAIYRATLAELRIFAEEMPILGARDFLRLLDTVEALHQ